MSLDLLRKQEPGNGERERERENLEMGGDKKMKVKKNFVWGCGTKDSGNRSCFCFHSQTRHVQPKKGHQPTSQRNNNKKTQKCIICTVTERHKHVCFLLLLLLLWVRQISSLLCLIHTLSFPALPPASSTNNDYSRIGHNS